MDSLHPTHRRFGGHEFCFKFQLCPKVTTALTILRDALGVADSIPTSTSSKNEKSD
jgi:hypothetical protein